MIYGLNAAPIHFSRVQSERIAKLETLYESGIRGLRWPVQDFDPAEHPWYDPDEALDQEAALISDWLTLEKDTEYIKCAVNCNIGIEDQVPGSFYTAALAIEDDDTFHARTAVMAGVMRANRVSAWEWLRTEVKRYDAAFGSWRRLLYDINTDPYLWGTDFADPDNVLSSPKDWVTFFALLEQEADPGISFRRYVLRDVPQVTSCFYYTAYQGPDGAIKTRNVLELGIGKDNLTSPGVPGGAVGYRGYRLTQRHNTAAADLPERIYFYCGPNPQQVYQTWDPNGNYGNNPEALWDGTLASGAASGEFDLWPTLTSVVEGLIS